MLNESFITESLGQLRKGHLPQIENAELYSEEEVLFFIINLLVLSF